MYEKIGWKKIQKNIVLRYRLISLFDVTICNANFKNEGIERLSRKVKSENIAEILKKKWIFLET